jgi:hypothetical protein
MPFNRRGKPPFLTMSFSILVFDPSLHGFPGSEQQQKVIER